MSVSAIPRSGKLEEQSFPKLLRALLREKRDGCLTVMRGAITRRLYLRGGMIIYGTSTERADRLGEILIAQGKLSKADLKKYWEQSQASNHLLGSTLVVNSCISMSDLYQGVTAQVVTILERLQKWRTGIFAFEEGAAPAAGTVLLRIPLALYLKADERKKPAAKKLSARALAKNKRGAAVTSEPAAPVAEQAPSPEAGAAGADEEFEIHELEAAAVERIDPEEALEQGRVGEVSFMVQELRKRFGKDRYATLGVVSGADHSAVQVAYHRIARVLHADQLPKSCPPELIREAGEVFREVVAAFQALEDPGRSAAPAAAPIPKAPSDEEQAKRFFAQGREWISKRNYWQAADALRQAVRLGPGQALYRQYLGLALMQIKRLPEAEEHLVEATRLDPNNPAHLVNLGRIYKSGRLFKKSREVFERALRLDPRNEHALDELSDMPDDPLPRRKPEGGGFLKKLFGKG